MGLSIRSWHAIIIQPFTQVNLFQALNTAHSRTSTDRIVRWVGRSPERLSQLVQHIMKGPARIQVRAAWPLSYCVESCPDLIKPHLKSLVRLLRSAEQDGAVKRSIVRLLQYVEVPKSLQGEVADHCFRFLADPAEAPAVRAFAMRVAENLARQNADLMGELRVILEDQLPYATPAFKNRAMKILGLKWDCRET